MVLLYESVPTAPVTFSVTVKTPALSKMCDGLLSLLDKLSPKSQLQPVAPIDISVNHTHSGGFPEVGLTLKEA
jgi:hypothetical protein